MSREAPRLHGWAFRLLLLALPRTFRRAYGEEMIELFEVRLQRARGRGSGEVARLWARLLRDVLHTALLERASGSEWGEGPETGRRDDEREVTLKAMIQDLGYALRRLIRTPVFTLSAVAIVAVGIGANAAVFSVVNDLLLAPPPYEDPGRVVRVYQDSDDGEPSSSSFPAYRDMASYDAIFTAVTAWTPATLPLETGEGIRDVSVEFVTSSHFDVLGLEPAMGRWFGPEHDQVGAGAFAVVSYRTWRTIFGSDPGVLGRTLRMNGQPVIVIGVGPESFRGSASPLATDFWLSISSVAVGGSFRVANLDRRQDHWYDVIARLAPGVSVEQSQAAMDALAMRLAEEYPELNRGRDITVFAPGEVRIHPDVDASLAPAVGVVMAVVALVLLLACSNLANLLLARGMARAPEMAVRRALGAGKGRVAGLLLGEALLLSLLGGVAGLLLARWALSLLPRLPLPLPGGSTLAVTMDHRVVIFASILVLATSVLFGLAPALRSAGWDLASTLRDGGAFDSPGRKRSLFRSVLVAVQVAVSLVLLVGAGLTVRSLVETQRVDPGVDVGRVAYVTVGLQALSLDAPQTRALLQQLEARVGAVPGVEAQAMTTRLPISGGGSTTTVVEGYVPESGTGSVELPFSLVSQGYWETMGIPLVAGRVFGPDDEVSSEVTVIMNEAAARRYWGSPEAAVGGRVRPQGAPDSWRRVVGIVADVNVGSLQEPPTPQMYFYLPRFRVSGTALVARTSGDPAALVRPLREAVREVNPSIVVREASTLEGHMGESLAVPRLAVGLLGGFSLLAVILACLGVYAVVAFSVARRTGEMGIRMALGAGRRGVVRLVVGEILGTVLVGLVVGLGAAFLAAPVLEGMLFGVAALDPATFAVVASLLAAVALVAAYLPARRAAATDPVEALRSR